MTSKNYYTNFLLFSYLLIAATNDWTVELENVFLWTQTTTNWLLIFLHRASNRVSCCPLLASFFLASSAATKGSLNAERSSIVLHAWDQRNEMIQAKNKLPETTSSDWRCRFLGPSPRLTASSSSSWWHHCLAPWTSAEIGSWQGVVDLMAWPQECCPDDGQSGSPPLLLAWACTSKWAEPG